MSSPISSVVVLAAGQGKRMKSDLPKVLHPVCGRPMLLHVLAAARSVEAARTVVVLGHGHERVVPHLPPDCVVALQEEQRGTGHAVLAAAMQIPEGAMLVVPGDTPLVTGEALARLVRDYETSEGVATVLTMVLADPTGYGRIIRYPDGSVARIVEHRDATEAERSVCEVNTGMYILPVPLALDILRTVGSDNDQGEIYLTDVVGGLCRRGERVSASVVSDPSLVLGVNSAVELAEAERLLGWRIKNHWMLEGVTMVDPASTSIGSEVRLSRRVLLQPFTTLAGRTSVEEGSEIGPCSTVIDTSVSRDCLLPHCYLRGTVVPPGTRLAPFAHLEGSVE